MEPAKAFFSFSRITDPTKHRAYGEWHMLDHGPENYALPGVIFGERWARSPRCADLSPAFDPVIPAESDHDLADTQYMTMYWFSDPADEALRQWNDLAARSFHWGRRPEIDWTERWMGFYTPIKGYLAPHVPIRPDALPFRPKRGIYVTVTELEGENTAINDVFQWYDEVRLPDVVATPGVAGAWTFASEDTYAGNHGARAAHRSRRLHLYFLDGDPVEVTAELAARRATWAAEGRDLDRADLEKVYFAGPMETIVPWTWDWFDR